MHRLPVLAALLCLLAFFAASEFALIRLRPTVMQLLFSRFNQSLDAVRTMR